MSPYARDEVHRQRCLSALGIDGSAIKADLYAVRVRPRPARSVKDAKGSGPTSLAVKRQFVMLGETAEKASVSEAAPGRRALVDPAPPPVAIAQPVLDNFTVVACLHGSYWFGAVCGEPGSSDYKAQRALFQSICLQFGGPLPSAVDAMHPRDEGLEAIFQWPPLKPAVLSLLGGVDQFAIYRRCVSERLPALVAEHDSTEGEGISGLFFAAELESPESAPVGNDERCVLWSELLAMPAESLRNVSRLRAQIGSRIVLLPSLSRMLTDAGLRRRVQTVLLLLSSRRMSARQE